MKILYVCLLAAAGTTFAQDSRSTGWIVIPVNEYGALRARAFPVERAPDAPPVEATLTRVDYELRIDGEIASGRATLTIDVLKDGWVRVPVPANLAVREARIEGKLVSLVRGDGALSAMLAKRGRSAMELDIALPVASSGGEERLILPASASGVTRASLAMTRPDVEVKVSGGLVAEHTDAESETRWVAFARGNEALAFTWRRKMEEQKRAQTKVATIRSVVVSLALTTTASRGTVLGATPFTITANIGAERYDHERGPTPVALALPFGAYDAP